MDQKGEDYNFWLEGFTRPSYPKLVEDLEIETLIIGGGITGIFSLYKLAKAGASVALIERGRVGEWTTDCTTGFLTQSIDTHYRDLIWALGQTKAKAVAESHRLAIDLIEQIVIEEKIDCDFERLSNTILAKNKEESKSLKKEAEALSKLGVAVNYSLTAPQHVSAQSLLEIKNQATYHPLKFLSSLATKAVTAGAKIFEQTEALALKRVGDRWQVTTGEQKIMAKNIIVATYSPWREPYPFYFKKALYRSYVLELEAPVNMLPNGLYEDLAQPYHYGRVINRGDKCQIIFGGEDHRHDLKIARAKNYQALKRHAQNFFNSAELKITRYWSGQLLESIDGLPYIGEDKKSSLFYAFGFSGNGLTYAAMAADLFNELITGQVGLMTRFKNLYSVNRWPSLWAMLVKGRDFSQILLGGILKNIFIKIK